MERGAGFKGWKPPRHDPFIYKTELKVSTQMTAVRILGHTGNGRGPHPSLLLTACLRLSPADGYEGGGTS